VSCFDNFAANKIIMHMPQRQLISVVALSIFCLSLTSAWAGAPKHPPAVSFFPTILDFEQIPSDERPTQLLRVTFDRRVFPPDHLPTLRCDFTNDAEVSLFSRVDGPQTITETYRVKLIGSRTGFLRCYLTLHRDPIVSREDDATVSVEDNGVIMRGEIVQGLDATSRMVEFGRVELGKGAATEYRVGVFGSNWVTSEEINARRKRREPDLWSMTVTSSSPYVTAPFHRGMGLNGSKWETWQIALSPKTPADFSGAELTFQTKNGYFLTVPVYAQIESPSPPEPDPVVKH